MSRSNRRTRGYERTDRVASTIREIVAEELLRIGDESVDHVAVTEVVVDNELVKATVYLSTLNLVDEEVEGVSEHSRRIRKAIANQARLRRTPELVFEIDPGLRSGERVDELLRRSRHWDDTQEPQDPR